LSDYDNYERAELRPILDGARPTLFACREFKVTSISSARCYYEFEIRGVRFKSSYGLNGVLLIYFTSFLGVGNKCTVSTFNALSKDAFEL